MANINKHASILEIGCGTGATTISLILSGFNVTVIEPSERMINAMTRNCIMYTGRLIEQYNIPAEEMDMLNAERFDVVLLECVFGFIKDKRKAIYEITRVLKPKGIIAITDFHYTKEPPLNLKKDLKEMFGIGNTLAKKDWVNYFDEMELIKWEPVATGGSTINAKSIETTLDETKLLDKLPGGMLGVEILAQKFADWEKIFTENRKYLSGFNAIWEINPNNQDREAQ